MNKPARLSRRDGELLLRLLEQNSLIITGTALEEMSFEVQSALINVGALEGHGVGRAVPTADDGGPTFRDLTWHPDQKAYGYFDASDGRVVFAPESQMLFRVALPWWLAWLAGSLALTNSGKPTELVRAAAWDIGDLWITRSHNVPVLFVRRLHRSATLAALRDALQKRAGRTGGLILTSGRNVLPQASVERFVVAPIQDLLTNDPQEFSIDHTLLRSPFLATDVPMAPGRPLHLSPDGRLLTIKGNVRVDFKSDIQIKLIRRLVDGHEEGKRWRAQELLDHAGSGVRTLARAFGSKKWTKLAPFMKSRDGLWGFDL